MDGIRPIPIPHIQPIPTGGKLLIHPMVIHRGERLGSEKAVQWFDGVAVEWFEGPLLDHLIITTGEKRSPGGVWGDASDKSLMRYC